MKAQDFINQQQAERRITCKNKYITYNNPDNINSELTKLWHSNDNKHWNIV